MIKKFENFQDEPYEKINGDKTYFVRVKNKSGSIMPFEEIMFIFNKVSNSIEKFNFHLMHYRWVNNLKVIDYYHLYPKENIDKFKNKEIIGIGWNVSAEIFKDDDEWYWFRMGDNVWRCDEFWGLKKLLIDKNIINPK